MFQEGKELKFVRVGVAVIVREADGRMLIDRRADGGPMSGWWEFPGGKVAPGETVADCIRRECREELGVEVEPVEPLRVITHEYPHARVELNFHLCRLLSGEPRPLEVAEVAWVTPAETSAYPFLPANTPVIEDLAKRLGGASS
jgi:A/G-specific adenine glycosylase